MQLSIEDTAPPTAEGALSDRRNHVRLPPEELAWIREVRLKYGPRVALIDLSSGGALLQTGVPLRPGTDLALEIVGRGVETIPLRVLRCQLAAIAGEGALYHGACEFKRPLDLTAPGGEGPVRADVALKHLLTRRRREGALTASPGSRGRLDRELPGLLRSIQATIRARDPLARAVCGILVELIPALERGEPAVMLKARLEERLRRAMPELILAIGPAPVDTRESVAESLYFSSSGQDGTAGVVNVKLPVAGPIPDWQLQLLEAGGALLELLPVGTTPETSASAPAAAAVATRETTERPRMEPPAMAPADSANPGWQKIVVRYREGRLLKGFSHDFHPSRTQFSLWPSINAAPAERVHIPTWQLKAVFFVRDFDGNPYRTDEPVFDRAQAGRRIEITFADDEVLVGSTLSYRPEGTGFFVIPGDRGANNLRVFVVASAIRHVRFP